LKERFSEDDPIKMCKVIKKTEKTCLAFEILAAGRKCKNRKSLEEAFCFENMKKKDAVVVRHFQKYKNQIKENRELFQKF